MSTEKKPSQSNKQGDKKFNFYYIYIAIALILISIYYMNKQSIVTETTWFKFENMALKGDVEKIIVVNNEFAEVYIKSESIKSDTSYSEIAKKTWSGQFQQGPHYSMKFLTVESFEKNIQELQNSIINRDTIGKTLEEKKEIIQNSRIEVIPETRKNWFGDILSWILPFAIIIIIWIFIMRSMSRGPGGGGQIFNVGKSKAQLFDKNAAITVNFKDVAGLDEAKVEVVEIIDFLRSPKKYTQLGGKIPIGVLL